MRRGLPKTRRPGPLVAATVALTGVVIGACSAPPPSAGGAGAASGTGAAAATDVAPAAGVAATPGASGGTGSTGIATGSATPPADPVIAPIRTFGSVDRVMATATRCAEAGARPFARWVEADAASARLRALGVAEPVIAGLPADKGRLLVIHGGDVPNPGYRLVIESIGRGPAGPLEVVARIEPPEPGGLQPQVIAYPCQVVTVIDSVATDDGRIDFALKR